MSSNQNTSSSTDVRSQKLQEAIDKADADLNRHKSVDVRRKEAMALKRREKAIAKVNSFLEEIRFQVQPHLLNTWKLIVTDEEKGLASVSQKYTKAMRRDEPTRQKIADACFKASINFQKRSREASVPKTPVKKKDVPKNAPSKILNLMEALFEESDIEDYLIEMLRIHRGRKTTANSTSNHFGVSTDENGDSLGSKRCKRIRKDVMAPLSSRKSVEEKNGSSRDILIYSKDAFRKAGEIRNEMMAEIILKWGLWDYKHMIAARRIEAKHMKRQLEPKLNFEKFCGGRFFTCTLEKKIVPKMREQKKLDPDFKVMPIIARDLKHAKGHFSFSSIERDIRGKGPGDNWTIREYTPAMPSMKKSPGRNPGPINDDHHDSMRSLGFSYDNADGSRMNGKRGHREI